MVCILSIFVSIEEYPIGLETIQVNSFQASHFLENFLHYLGRRRLCAEFGRGFRVPRLGPLFSTIGATYGIPEGS